MLELLNFITHIDSYLLNLVTTYGSLTYLVLFLIVFCETGLVIIPFLPGDSLLFAAGTLAGHPSQPLNVQLLFIGLTLAAILGNKLNYFIGSSVGIRLFRCLPPWLANPKHLVMAEEFYAKHGGKTLLIARFLPVIRSFAPFTAAISRMSLKQFSFYNIASALLWTSSLLGFGFFFGSLPFVQSHFSFFIYGIIACSALPPLILYFLRHKTR